MRGPLPWFSLVPGVSGYEVLAGIAVEDSRVWNLIVALRRAEEDCFGRRVTAAELELKAKKLLKPKTFRLAAQMPAMEPSRMRGLARACLEEGAAAHTAMRTAKVTKDQLTALGQAKVIFATTVVELLATHQVRVFASTYVIAWGLRFDVKRLTRPARPELEDLAKRVYGLRYIATEREGRRTSSLAIIPDLRPLEEKELEGG